MKSQGWSSDDTRYGGPRWKPETIDVERPSPARIYDYLLGGAHNFAVDRQVAEQMIAVHPEARQAVLANRAFLRRVTQYLVDAGVRQYLDIGSGIPTVGHVHEIVQPAVPDTRVIYVDIDPVAVAHSRDILRGNDLTGVIEEDVRNPERILGSTAVSRLFDFDEPVAVLMMGLLHFVSDEDNPQDVLERLTEPLSSGSYLAISHMTNDGAQDMDPTQEISRRADIEMTIRTRRQVEALFAGFDLIEPGVVWVPEWHPESPLDIYYDRPEMATSYGGVGRKP
jgi:SAM-dependent methyltransferase